MIDGRCPWIVDLPIIYEDGERYLYALLVQHGFEVYRLYPLEKPWWRCVAYVPEGRGEALTELLKTDGFQDFSAEPAPMGELSREVSDDTERRPNGGGRTWYLSGPLGGVHLSFSYRRDYRDDESYPGGWMGGSVIYHSPHPLYEGRRPLRGDCPYVPGGRCYQSGLDIPQNFPREWWAAGRDDEVIWRTLELSYRRFFVEATPEEPMIRMSRILSEVLGQDEMRE
jgi:hypothetical protein